ncbi:flippase [Thiomicrorhabdus sp.]|uniref:flippase n=1 Tax=Thiomicrorhabdus sp. TaxID=2039724 RepID=UPI0029C81DBE|nr:flippase [Thiomicrorhabdus sp.]
MFSVFSKLMAHSGVRRYLGNISWSFIEQFFRLIVGFLVTIWVIRYLGPDDFGVYAYVTSFVMLFSILARLGLNNVVIKEIVENEGIEEKLINTAFSLKLIGSIFIFLIMIFSSFAFDHSFQVNWFIAIVGIGMLFQSLEVIEFFHQAKVNIKPIIIAKVIQLFLSSLIKVILIISNSGLEAFVWVALFDIASVSLFYLWIYVQSDRRKLSLDFDKDSIRRLWMLGWPIALSNMAMIAYVKMDQIMLFNLMDAEAVGLYAAASKISEAWYFLPTMLTATLFPAILNAKKKDQKLYEDRTQGLFALMILVGVSVALPVTFLSGWLINVLYGAAYQEAATVLVIHIWVGVFIALGMAASKWFVAENLQKLFLVRTVTGLLINFILNLLLIPIYGIMGAAVATLISVIFANVIAYLFNKKLWPLFMLTIKSFNLFLIARYVREFK